MEPLVIFGAFLVIYCGYLSALDAVRVWRREPRAVSEKRARSKKRAQPCRSARAPHATVHIPIGGTLLQRG